MFMSILSSTILKPHHSLGTAVKEATGVEELGRACCVGSGDVSQGGESVFERCKVSGVLSNALGEWHVEMGEYGGASGEDATGD